MKPQLWIRFTPQRLNKSIIQKLIITCFNTKKTKGRLKSIQTLAKVCLIFFRKYKGTVRNTTEQSGIPLTLFS